MVMATIKSSMACTLPLCPHTCSVPQTADLSNTELNLTIFSNCTCLFAPFPKKQHLVYPE